MNQKIKTGPAELPVEGGMSILDLMAAASNRVEIQDVGVDIACRFPVVVEADTKLFLEAQARAMGQSLAGLCGVILNEVVHETKRRAMCNEGG